MQTEHLGTLLLASSSGLSCRTRQTVGMMLSPATLVAGMAHWSSSMASGRGKEGGAGPTGLSLAQPLCVQDLVGLCPQAC